MIVSLVLLLVQSESYDNKYEMIEEYQDNSYDNGAYYYYQNMNYDTQDYGLCVFIFYIFGFVCAFVASQKKAQHTQKKKTLHKHTQKHK